MDKHSSCYLEISENLRMKDLTLVHSDFMADYFTFNESFINLESCVNVLIFLTVSSISRMTEIMAAQLKILILVLL